MRKISEEMLGAYADGELGREERERVEQALAEDEGLRAELELQRKLKARLGAAFDPVLEEEVPASLSALLEPRGQVIDFAAAKEKRVRRIAWPQFAAMAASLAVGVVAGRVALSPSGPVEMEGGVMLARGDLADALETRLASAQGAGAAARVGISFADKEGRLCRTFDASAMAGIACREEQGWAIAMAAASSGAGGEYRQAGAPELVLEQAQAMMAGEPLDAEAEKKALRQGWSRR